MNRLVVSEELYKHTGKTTRDFTNIDLWVLSPNVVTIHDSHQPLCVDGAGPLVLREALAIRSCLVRLREVRNAEGSWIA